MKRRQIYFMKQKLLGAALVLLGIIAGLVSFVMSELALISLVCITGGLGVCFTKKMLLVDDYFDEVNKRRDRRL